MLILISIWDFDFEFDFGVDFDFAFDVDFDFNVGVDVGFPTLNSMPNIRIIIWGVWRPHSTPKIRGVGYTPPHAHAMPAIQLESPT